MNASILLEHLFVVDDHEVVLNGTVNLLLQAYPNARIRTASTAQATLALMNSAVPNLLVMDLCIPQSAGSPTAIEVGIRLLRQLMERYPELNIAVQSAHAVRASQLKPLIDVHKAGFVLIEKSLPVKEMLAKVDWALQGLIFIPKHMRDRLQVRPEWLEVLTMAFQEGLQDKVIAERMHVSERTVRHYWTRVQGALDVYPEDGKNIRIQTGIRAREEGLVS